MRNERQQFRSSDCKIWSYSSGKLAEQAIRDFAAESAIYRCSQNMEDAIHALREQGMEGKAKLKGGAIRCRSCHPGKYLAVKY